MDHAPDFSATPTQQALYTVVEEVIDTVATFDGRFSYSPISPDGRCLLSFASRDTEFTLVVQAQLVDPDSVIITSCRLGGDRVQEEPRIVYFGPFNGASVRHHLGGGLADWYGKLVRNQVNED